MEEKHIIAILGPSGAGKTTLGNNLEKLRGVVVPRHCTTRLRRNDDREGFYRYLSHEKYKALFDQGQFLITSGDGPEIKKEYGNFYGVLYNDCLQGWNKNNIIALFVSYKDIDTLLALQDLGIDVNLVNLTFSNIPAGVKMRLVQDPTRNHTKQDIESRIRCAISDDEKYGNKVKIYAKTTVYTDQLDAKQTYTKVCADLGLWR